MTIKCLAFDLDGTLLLDESKKMDPRTVDSIQRAMAQGMHIVIASGRDKNGCQCGYDFYSYISSLNRVKKKVKNAILGEPDDYGLKDGKENRNFIDLPFEEIRLTQDINKVIMVHSPRFFEKNFEGIKAALSDYDVLLIGPDWLEIMPKHVTKASALWKICDKLGISMNEVMAFGDAQNDLKMLQQVGIGVAMGNAMDEAKYAATVITDTNMNNGIGKAIDALLAGKEMDLRKGLL